MVIFWKYTSVMGYSRKNPNRGGGRGWGYAFLKSPPGNFRFVTLPQVIPERKSFYPWKFCKFVWHPLEIPKSKTKTHGNSALVFLEHPGISTSFLIDPWNFHMFFLQDPQKFHVLNPLPPPVWIFSGIAQWQKNLLLKIFYPQIFLQLHSQEYLPYSRLYYIS